MNLLVSDADLHHHHYQQAASDTMLLEPDAAPLILLAEDNELSLELLRDFLQGRHYNVLEVRTGREAVDQARSARPDLIIMDVQMPVLNGLEAIELLRADKHVQHIPIIAMTALAMASDRENCLSAGATAYVSKPASMKQLATLIAACLLPEPCNHQES